jgi:RNA polymerase sigma-70 factor, ECF subfamily
VGEGAPVPPRYTPRAPFDDDAEGVGDPRPSWEEVATRYGSQIYNIAYRLTGDPHDAADLAQDVFERVYRNLHRYEPGTFEGWLYRITKNLFLDRVRHKARLRLEPLADREWDEPASAQPGPADVVQRRTLEARVEAALRSLPPDFRLAVVLCDIEGLAYEEIAAATGWPMGTVRSRIHRGRRQMRNFLEQQASDEPTPPERPGGLRPPTPPERPGGLRPPTPPVRTERR